MIFTAIPLKGFSRQVSEVKGRRPASRRRSPGREAAEHAARAAECALPAGGVDPGSGQRAAGHPVTGTRPETTGHGDYRAPALDARAGRAAPGTRRGTTVYLIETL